MSKRITLTDEDIKLIVDSLWYLHRHSIVNSGAYPEHATASKQRVQQLEDKFFPVSEESEDTSSPITNKDSI